VKYKKVLFILIIILIFFTFGFIIYDTFFKIKVNNENIIFSTNLDVLVYDKVFVSDFIESIDGKIISDKLVDTAMLGQQRILFLYEDKIGSKKLGSFFINVVDLEEPKIFINDSYTVVKDSDDFSVDILMSVDNYDKNPSREIIGYYDLSKVGNYDLTYKVVDSSGNVSSVDFELKVVLEKVNNIKTNSYTDFNDVFREHKKDNTMIGIDVSKWQGKINFKEVKDSSCEFVMIRLGYQDGIGGESKLDPYFEENIKNAILNNLKVGVYYYSHAKGIEEVKEQALWVVDKLSSYKVDLPVVFDWENWKKFNSYKISLYDINKLSDIFMNIVEANGYNYMLYGSKYYLENIWDVSYKNIWLAHYTKQTNYTNEYMMWQLCDNGRIKGIDGYVDIDILYL